MFRSIKKEIKSYYTLPSTNFAIGQCFFLITVFYNSFYFPESKYTVFFALRPTTGIGIYGPKTDHLFIYFLTDYSIALTATVSAITLFAVYRAYRDR